jgi:LmbE family N-acetylglucosaminyl deacetylase
VSVPLLAISPHFDDAVLSLGATLAATPGAVVVTVFGGRPARYPPATRWDTRCGFADGEDVVAVRVAEDEAALALLGARPLRLNFVDAQYVETGAAPPNTPGQLGEALAGVIEELRPDAVAAPLGLFHRDHRAVAAACLPLLGPSWRLWVDVPYRSWSNVGTRVAALARCGVRLSAPHERPDPGGRKRAAVAAYASQQRGLRGLGLGDGGPVGLAPPDRVHAVTALVHPRPTGGA